MRKRLVVIILCFLLVVTSGAILAFSASTSHYQASVKGQLLISGGPAPGTPRPTQGEVTATSTSGQSFAVSVPATGRFTLSLRAGTYSLVGSSPEFGSGQYKCLANREITVPRDMVVHVDVVCAEK